MNDRDRFCAARTRKRSWRESMGFEAVVPVQEIALVAKEVPPEFVVTEEVQKTLHNSPDDEYDDALQLPVIDFQPLLDASTGKEGAERVMVDIGQACEEWGFFQVINHGIPESLLESVLGVVHGFFSLPLEEKQAYAMKPGKTQGYGRVMKPKIRPWSDAFRHAVRPRPAPDQDARPKTPLAYREVMDEYAEEIVKLSRTLTSVLSEYLGLEATALQNALAKEPDAYPAMTVTVNLYPKCPQPDRVLGIYPHSDAGAMTVLYQNEVEGLQVRKGGRWVTVKPRKNALVVNVSDQLEVLSNGRLKSSKHRAVVNSKSPRISIAAFCGPGSPDVVIGPMPDFIDASHPSAYPTMTYSNYSSSYFRRDMETKPLSLLQHSVETTV